MTTILIISKTGNEPLTLKKNFRRTIIQLTHTFLLFFVYFGSCVVFLVHGTIIQQWTSLLKYSASLEKKNLGRYCWRIVSVTVEQSCQWLLNNHASDSWTIVPVTAEQSRQRLLKNRASHCWIIMPVTVEQSCQWLLNNCASDCWRIMPATVE